jgi:hypothetical protein
MDGMVEDGTGGSYRVKVDSRNRFHVDSLTKPEGRIVAEEGRAFNALSIGMTFNSTNPHAILRIVNLDQNRNMAIESIMVSWNGGDADHNRAMYMELFRDMDAPSANYNDFSPVNSLVGDPNPAIGTFNRWDGVGDGMTIAATGTPEFAAYVGQGLTIIPWNGTIILPYGRPLGVQLTPEQLGGYSLDVGFYYIDR